jgi:hypothetical protein
MSDTEQTAEPVILIEPISLKREDNDRNDLLSHSEDQDEPPVRRDKRGRKMTQKRVEAIHAVREKAASKRREVAEKAKLYEEVLASQQEKSSAVDYDKLSEMVADKIIEKRSAVKESKKSATVPASVGVTQPEQVATVHEVYSDSSRYRQPKPHILF